MERLVRSLLGVGLLLAQDSRGLGGVRIEVNQLVLNIADEVERVVGTATDHA